MNSSKITSLFILIWIILSKSDVLARVLLAAENPNPNKDTQKADKEQNQNPEPQKPVGYQLNSSDSENVKDAAQSKLSENNAKDKGQELSNTTSSNKDKMGDIREEIDGKSKSGKEENIGSSESGNIGKNENLKGSDDTTKNESKERGDSSKENKESEEGNDSSKENGKNNNETKATNKSSQENGKIKTESKESNNISKSQENNDNNEKPKESNAPATNQEIGRKNDVLKESNDTTNGQENGKMNNESEIGNNPSNDKEKVKQNEEPIETSVPLKGQVNDKKDAGEVIGPYKRGEKDKNDKEESKGDGKNVDGKQKVKLPTENENFLDKPQLDMCDVSLQKCQKYDLVACLQHSKTDSRKLVIAVQNMGDNSLTVNITVPPSVKINSNLLNLAKHSSEKISISSYNTKSLKVVLNAGKGDCTIQIGIGPSIADWFQQFPAYANQVTPTYVAYFLLVTLIIVGVIFGLCKFRRRGKKVDSGVQYQQLEMGNQIQSSSEVVEASTLDGWNQGWADDWDEEDEISMHQNSNLNGNLSSNRLSSRQVNRRSDWDVDWDE